MKKTILAIAAVFAIVSCQKEEVEMTATEPMAGQWLVTCNVGYNDGTPEDVDGFGMGEFLMLTYNESANSDNVIFVDDLQNFWKFKGKVSCNQSNLTFGSDSPIDNEYYPMQFVVKDGKILNEAATTPSGAKADSISFVISFGDDADEGIYYDYLRITGYRYTGLASDEP